MNDFKFEMGQPVKDIVTGFKGIIVRRSQWLNNCNTYGVQSTKLDNGKIQAAQHFDEPQLIAGKGVNQFKGESKRVKTGGPERHFSRPQDKV